MSKTTSLCVLVGGQSHGTKMEILDSVDSVEVPVYLDVDDQTNSAFSALYTRRSFAGDAAEERWVYFGHAGDDDTETEALARYLRSGRERPMDQLSLSDSSVDKLGQS